MLERCDAGKTGIVALQNEKSKAHDFDASGYSGRSQHRGAKAERYPYCDGRKLPVANIFAHPTFFLLNVLML